MERKHFMEDPEDEKWAKLPRLRLLFGREPRAALCQPSSEPRTLPGLGQSQMDAHLGCTAKGGSEAGWGD